VCCNLVQCIVECRKVTRSGGSLKCSVSFEKQPLFFFKGCLGKSDPIAFFPGKGLNILNDEELLQCVAVCCSGLATRGFMLEHTATHCNTMQHAATRCSTLQHTVTHCHTLLHTATHCNTLQHTAKHIKPLQIHTPLPHTATPHRNTLQHTATHCNTH